MFDGNGNWTSDFSAQADRDNGIKILASRFDNIFIADIKESFENCLTKDGQIAPIGNFNMGGQRITNLNDGVNDNDAVNMSQFNNAVHKTGDERITGSKTFYSNTGPIRIGNPDVERGVAPASDIYTVLRFEDKDGNVMGVCESRQTPDGAVEMRFNVWNNDYSQYSMGLRRFSNGTEYGFCPPSDAVSSIVTTEGINKDANGYVKLGNGLIIQWGRFTNTNNTFSVTLPTPFTTNNYSIAYGCLDSQRSGDNTITTNTTSTTGFTGWISCHSTNLQSQWIAIGY